MLGARTTGNEIWNLSKKPGGSMSINTPITARLPGRPEKALFHSGNMRWQCGQPLRKKMRIVFVPSGKLMCLSTPSTPWASNGSILSPTCSAGGGVALASGAGACSHARSGSAEAPAAATASNPATARRVVLIQTSEPKEYHRRRWTGVSEGCGRPFVGLLRAARKARARPRREESCDKRKLPTPLLGKRWLALARNAESDGRSQIHASYLAPHLTAANRDAVLARAAHRSTRDIEDLVAELAP